MVRITWHDSSFDPGWQYATRRPQPDVIVSIGYVVENNKDVLTFSSTIGTRGGSLCPINVPWRSIINLEVLTDPTKASDENR